MNVLSVSYALAPVALDAVGGAEVVLAEVDQALVARGHRSLVVAPEGSCVRGELLATPAVPSAIDEAARRAAARAHHDTVARALDRHAIDVVLCHGLDFDETLPPPGDDGTPRVIALHLPISFYPAGAIERALARGDVLVCVSSSQASDLALPVRVIENGVALDRYRARTVKHGYALALGRVCPEKNLPAAIAAARLARVPLVIAGAVFPYEAHQRHFEDEVVPALEAGGVLWAGAVRGARKRRLLAGARCVLVPSLARETSSLVAMEALASGTPVVAYASGALAGLVEDGRTGFLVHDPVEMAAAIRRVSELDPRACRAAAEARFDLARTVERWIAELEHAACGSGARASRGGGRAA